MKPVYLYTDGPSKSLEIGQIVEFLSDLNISCEYKGSLFDLLNLDTEGTGQLNQNISLSLIDDIETEKLNTGKTSADPQTGGRTLYDGFLFSRIINRYLLVDPTFCSSAIHIIFTGRLLCTFENRRYHARVILMGIPNYISTSGLIEAPARPREYYFLKAQFIASGKDIAELDEYFEGKYLLYDDPKTTNILKAYTLMAVFYELTGEPFCNNEHCCLYNSHWQSDVLQTQYKGNLCSRHSKILENLSPVLTD